MKLGQKGYRHNHDTIHPIHLITTSTNHTTIRAVVGTRRPYRTLILRNHTSPYSIMKQMLKSTGMCDFLKSLVRIAMEQ